MGTHQLALKIGKAVRKIMIMRMVTGGGFKDDEDEEEDMNLNWEVMSTVHQAGLQNRESCPHYLCSSPPRHAHAHAQGHTNMGKSLNVTPQM